MKPTYTPSMTSRTVLRSVALLRAWLWAVMASVTCWTGSAWAQADSLQATIEEFVRHQSSSATDSAAVVDERRPKRVEF